MKRKTGILLSNDRIFNLGPYTLDFTSSGRHMAVCGLKGHGYCLNVKYNSQTIEMILSSDTVLLTDDVQVRETVCDVVFLHNESFFAAVQKNMANVLIPGSYPYIYNRDGTELHCLKEHGAVLRLQFLKTHFLLASINNFGQLHYQDVTMGEMVGSYRTGLGRADVMQGPPLGNAFHPNGHLMATAGKENKIKLWDLRKLEDEALQTLPGQPKTLDFSRKVLLACLGCGSSVQILRDLHGTQNYKTYMNHRMVKGYQIEKLLFRPCEDVLDIGHSMGWSSILIPGCGEPNFDSWVANPFETSKHRSEREVHSLLDKLPPETIMLDPAKIGTRKKEKPTKQEKEVEIEAVKGTVLKKKTKGRNKPSKRTTTTEEIIANAKRPFLEQQMKEEEQLARKKQKTIEQVELPTSSQRFAHTKATA
ncbi:hypothetical protein PRUPE_1G365200 [Prunus persica]|uniref:BING4 C-terminal domain-containing protein n=1 Tax=Prunus persica TaxID=3760 RepID=A0A251R8P3_PRUPE|nr:hypothetical protein PRUPE_1G365200 [Prunus persica]